MFYHCFCHLGKQKHMVSSRSRVDNLGWKGEPYESTEYNKNIETICISITVIDAVLEKTSSGLKKMDSLKCWFTIKTLSH